MSTVGIYKPAVKPAIVSNNTWGPGDPHALLKVHCRNISTLSNACVPISGYPFVGRGRFYGFSIEISRTLFLTHCKWNRV